MKGLSGNETRRRDEFAGRLFQSAINAGEIMSVYLGCVLGFYKILGAGNGLSPKQLASKAGTDERYTREWLEQQAVAGILEVDNMKANENERKYSMPAGHAEVLLDEDSVNYMAALPQTVVSILGPLDKVIRAFKTGKGVPYRIYGESAVEGQADMNRSMYLNLLGPDWMPKIPDVHKRLLSDPPARVADMGCGAGWSCIALAKAYPKVFVNGFDLDGDSIALAKENAKKEGLEDRVKFYRRNASDPKLSGQYDLVTAFETIHDMAQPVEALRNMRKMLVKGGSVIVMDEKVQETFTAPGDEIERFMYVASIFFCLPTSRETTPSAATGTAMRPATLKKYAESAGLRGFRILPIDHMFWRFYQLRP